MSVSGQIGHFFGHIVLLPGVAAHVVGYRVGRVTPSAVRVKSIVVSIASENQHKRATDEYRGVEKARRWCGGQQAPLPLNLVVRIEPAREYLSDLGLGHIATVHVDEIAMGVVGRAVTVATLDWEAKSLDDLPLASAEQVLLDGIQVTILRRVPENHHHLFLLVAGMDEVRGVSGNLD